eukprot:COSAG04_NODE_1138_length_8106_cov_4.244036_4_plen_691_part_00
MPNRPALTPTSFAGGVFTYDSCCNPLDGTGNALCWMAEHNYASCQCEEPVPTVLPPPPPRPHEDDEVGTEDVLAVLAAFGDESGLGDTNGDGATDVADLLHVQAQFGKDHSSGTTTSCTECAVPSVETMASSKDGYATYRLSLVLGPEAANCYSIFGDGEDMMMIPGGFQVLAPFGADLGGTNPAFWAFNANAEFDSWLTIGPTDGGSSDALGTIGIPMADWTEAAGMEVSDGAVFWMSPDDGPGGTVTVAQLTIAAGTEWTAVLSAQGRSAGGGEDWDAFNVFFTNGVMENAPWIAPPDYVTPVVTALGASYDAAHTTYTLSVELSPAAANVYTIFGRAESTGSMLWPPAYQCAAPFGANTGGTNDAFWAIANNAMLGYAQFDSWLTVGIEGGDTTGALSSFGIDFDSWTETAGLEVTDGAVYWMAPGDAPGGTSVVGQITVEAGASGAVVMGMQGRTVGRSAGEEWTPGSDWTLASVSFGYGSSAGDCDNPAECAEPHPAAVCALPTCDADDDDALLALRHAESNLGLLTYKFCHDCACLAAHSMCEELREGLPGLDEACGCSCATPRTPEERGCVAASLPTPPWRTDDLIATPADQLPTVRPQFLCFLRSSSSETKLLFETDPRCLRGRAAGSRRAHGDLALTCGGLSDAGRRRQRRRHRDSALLGDPLRHPHLPRRIAKHRQCLRG